MLASGDVNRCSHCGKQFRDFLEISKQNYHMILQFQSGYMSKKPKSTNSKRSLHLNVHSSTTSSLTTAKIWKQPKCPSTDEWIEKIWCIIYLYIHVVFIHVQVYIVYICDTHTYYTTTYPLKRTKFCHFRQHTWTWRALNQTKTSTV